MSVELAVLAAVALLSLALALLSIAVQLRRFGGAAIRGDREDYPRLDGLAGRVARAHANLNEALPPFAAVVLTAAVLRVGDGWTAGAAEVFLGARIAHATLYVAGFPVLRSAAFYVGLVATAALASRLPWAAVLH